MSAVPDIDVVVPMHDEAAGLERGVRIRLIAAGPIARFAGVGVASTLAYANAHGGGTVGVSSQTGAASAIIASGANVAGIGGFSGRESAVSASWLADAVSAGQIRWVLTESGGGFGGPGNDGRTGSTTAMAAVQRACTPVTAVSGLYDCQGQAAAIAGATT